MKNNNFVKFKKFLSEKCYSEKEYGDGKYDKKIYNYLSQALEKQREEIVEMIERVRNSIVVVEERNKLSHLIDKIKQNGYNSVQ